MTSTMPFTPILRYGTLRPVLCLALALLILANAPAKAQWSADPNDPMVVCDAPNTQQNVKALSDGADGWYVFWTDRRNNPSRAQLYGQHFNHDGVAQWTANGKLILGLPGSSVNALAAVRIADGNVMIAVLSSATIAFTGDTARAILVDSNGSHVWSSPALLSVNGPGIFGNCEHFDEPMGVPSGDGAYFAYHGRNQWPAQDHYCVIQRVRADGSVAFAVPGLEAPSAGPVNDFTVHPDGAEGMMIGWRWTTTVGSHKATRVDSLGTALWSAPLDITAGGAGVYLNWMFIPDESGSFVSVWDESANIGMERCDTTGSLLWTPGPYYACTAPGDQSTPAAAVSAGDLFVAWCDESLADLRLQKFDLATGTAQWPPLGLPVISATSSYSLISSIFPSDSGSVIGMMHMNGGLGYCARRILNDGTPAWPSPVPLALVNGPFLKNKVEMPDGEGGLVSFWMSQVGNLYGTRIKRDGSYASTVGTTELEDPHPLLLHPNPSSDHITVQAVERMDRLEVWSADGRPVLVEAPFAVRADIALTALPSGPYTVRSFTASGVRVARFIKL